MTTNKTSFYSSPSSGMTEIIEQKRACSYADYSKQDLSEYVFEYYIQSSKFDGCILPDELKKIKFECCSFDKTDLRSKYIHEVEFIDCTFDKTDIRTSYFKDCSFVRCDFIVSDFRDSQLLDTTFIDSKYSSTDFRNCTFTKIEFTEEEAKECDLRDIIII